MTFVYDFYEDVLSDRDPILNTRKPILFSISSLRKHNNQCNICVYDSGNVPQRWDAYQDEFRFEVRYSSPFRFAVGFPLADSRSMQKLWTLTEDDFKDTTVASVSNNLIFLSDPTQIPFQDYLCGGDREGIFYHNRASDRSCLMMERWKADCVLFLERGQFQQKVFQFNKRRFVNENIVMNHLLSGEIPDYWRGLPEGIALQFYSLDKFQGWMRSVVLNESFVGIDKVKIIPFFRELFDATRCAHYLRDKAGTPRFSLKDLASQGKVREMRSILGLNDTAYFQFTGEPPLWSPPLHEIMGMWH